MDIRIGQVWICKREPLTVKIMAQDYEHGDWVYRVISREGVSECSRPKWQVGYYHSISAYDLNDRWKLKDAT